MKNTFLPKAALSVLLCASYVRDARSQTQIETDRVIVKIKSEICQAGGHHCESSSSARVASLDGISQKYNAAGISKIITGKRSKQCLYVIKFPAGTNLQEVIDEYYSTGKVEYAEPDHIGSAGGTELLTVPNDAQYSKQWGLKNNGTFSPGPAKAGADIDMELAWNITQGDTSIVVGIMDSGCRLGHPDLAGRIWKNYAEVPNNGADDDGNGRIDDTKGGWDFTNSDNDPTDDHGHGSNVVGIIGATGNNSIGFAGMDWKCKLMILKGLDASGNGFYSEWASAMYYAADNGANVINMSVGGSTSSQALQDATNYCVSNGVTVVVCMMNANNNATYYPAGCSGVIAVGSTSANDTRSNPFFWGGGSNYGNHISVVAPGNYIYGLDYQSNTNYNSYWGGTSQAAPHVAGLASLLLAQNKTRTPAQIKSIIQTTAEDKVGLVGEDVTGWDQYYGHGRINAYAALMGTTGRTEIPASSSDLKLFPNPLSGSMVHFSLADADKGPFTVEIRNMLGQLVFAEQTAAGTGGSIASLDLKQKPEPGIYCISILTESKVCHSRLVVE